MSAFRKNIPRVLMSGMTAVSAVQDFGRLLLSFVVEVPEAQK